MIYINSHIITLNCMQFNTFLIKETTLLVRKARVYSSAILGVGDTVSFTFIETFISQ